MLAVAHPWASASSYLSSQSLADSRCNLHATSRSSELSSFSPLSLHPLSRRSPLRRSATTTTPADPLLPLLLSPLRSRRTVESIFNAPNLKSTDATELKIPQFGLKANGVQIPDILTHNRR